MVMVNGVSGMNGIGRMNGVGVMNGISVMNGIGAVMIFGRGIGSMVFPGNSSFHFFGCL